MPAQAAFSMGRHPPWAPHPCMPHPLRLHGLMCGYSWVSCLTAQAWLPADGLGPRSHHLTHALPQLTDTQAGGRILQAGQPVAPLSLPCRQGMCLKQLGTPPGAPAGFTPTPLQHAAVVGSRRLARWFRVPANSPRNCCSSANDSDGNRLAGHQLAPSAPKQPTTPRRLTGLSAHKWYAAWAHIHTCHHTQVQDWLPVVCVCADHMHAVAAA